MGAVLRGRLGFSQLGDGEVRPKRKPDHGTDLDRRSVHLGSRQRHVRRIHHHGVEAVSLGFGAKRDDVAVGSGRVEQGVIDQAGYGAPVLQERRRIAPHY